MLRLIILVENFTIGGAQRMVYEEIKNIDQNNTDLLVICYQTRRHTDLEASVEKIAKVIYLNIDGHVRPKDIVKVFNAINSFKPDIVHTHLTGQVFAIPWSIIFKKSLVITAHTRPNMAFVKKTEHLLRFGLRHGKIHVVTVSDENHRLMTQYFGGVSGKISLINNGVSLDGPPKKEHELFTFINVARQDENKNQAMILDCFKQINRKYPQTKLILVGDGPLHSKLQERVRQFALQYSVVLTGNISNVEDYYSISDVYIQASHREALPMSVLEAMAAKLPIISTNVGGLKDVVIDNGWLINDGDVDSLFCCMEKIYVMDKDKRNQLGDNSHKIVQNYSSKVMTEKYVDLFLQIKGQQ